MIGHIQDIRKIVLPDADRDEFNQTVHSEQEEYDTSSWRKALVLEASKKIPEGLRNSKYNYKDQRIRSVRNK